MGNSQLQAMRAFCFVHLLSIDILTEQVSGKDFKGSIYERKIELSGQAK